MQSQNFEQRAAGALCRDASRPATPASTTITAMAADTAETTTSSVTVAHTPTRTSTLRAPKPAVRSRRRPGWLALASLTAVLSLAACGDGGTGSDAAGQSSTSGKAVSPAESTTAGADTSLAPSTLATADTESAAAPVSGHLQTKALPAIATAGSPCDTMLAATSAMLPATSAAQVQATARPSYLMPTLDSLHRSCVVRITNNRAQGDSVIQRNDYSRRQAFNADSSRFLLNNTQGFWLLYDARSGRQLEVLSNLQGTADRLAGDAEPFWHPTNPKLLYFIPTNGVGMRIYRLDLRTHTVTTVADMGAQIRRIWPDADMAYTKAEGSPSADGRYWCFMARHYANSSSQPMRGVFTWDLDQHRIIGHLAMSDAPDHVSMTPTGRYCTVSHDTAAGTRAYNRTFKAPYNGNIRGQYLQLHSKSEHSDIAFNKLMQDVYVSLDYQSDKGEVFMVNLEDGRRTPLFNSYIDRTAMAFHVSGKAYAKPGWVLMSTYGEHYGPAPTQRLSNLKWPHRRMFAVSLNANPDIRAIASVQANVYRYEDEPHATTNRDFTRMLFNSTWNGSSTRDMEVFMVAIKPTALDKR